MTTELTAGRELDALIAEQVFEMTVVRDWPCGHLPDGCGLEVWEEAGAQFSDETPEDYAYRRDRTEAEKEESGWYRERHPCYIVAHENGWNEKKVVPFYSTDETDAFLVAGKLLSEGRGFNLEKWGDEWEACFRAGNERTGLTPSHAICLAALAIPKAARRVSSRESGT